MAPRRFGDAAGRVVCSSVHAFKGLERRVVIVTELDEIDPAWYEGAGVVGLTAGASVPDELLEPIIEDLRERGVTKVEPVIVAEETIEFRPPEELDG